MDWLNALQHAMDAHRDRCVAPPVMQIISVSPSGNRFEIELRFESGKEYCCAEPGCFLSSFADPSWTEFRRALAECTDREPPLMTMVVHGVVEAGALLRYLLLVQSSMTSRAYSYQSEPYVERGPVSGNG